MRSALIFIAAGGLLVSTLAACSRGGEPAVQAPVTPSAASAPTAEAPKARVVSVDPEQAALLKDLIHRHGGSCADIVGLRSLGDLSNQAEVTCVETAGGTNQARYTVDLGSEEVRKSD